MAAVTTERADSTVESDSNNSEREELWDPENLPEVDPLNHMEQAGMFKMRLISILIKVGIPSFKLPG